MKKSRMQSLMAVVGATATIFGLTSCGDKAQQQMDMTPEIATITVEEGSSDLASNFAAKPTLTCVRWFQVSLRKFMLTKVSV